MRLFMLSFEVIKIEQHLARSHSPLIHGTETCLSLGIPVLILLSFRVIAYLINIFINVT